MHSKPSFRFLTGAYSLANSAGLFQSKAGKRVFTSSYFLYKRYWEDPFAHLLRRIPRLLGTGDIFDIGANIGYTACLFAEASKIGSKVYAFEPDQANFQILTEVVRRKDLAEKILALNLAVGDVDGTVQFWHNEKHAGDHRVVTNYSQDSHSVSGRTSSVPAISIDSFVETRNLENVSFVKIDVQGYELPVCMGMQETLQKFPDLCVCSEYSPESLVELGYNPEDLLAFFWEKGYSVHILTRTSLALATDRKAIDQMAAPSGYVDLLCARRVLV
jgi:FkbM family methyltransferase